MKKKLLLLVGLVVFLSGSAKSVEYEKIFPNGDRYVGELKNDKMHGKGIYYFITGNKYSNFILS